MQVTNDNSCSWINDLDPRTNIKTLSNKKETEWLIIGAGFTGLSTARKLSQLNPEQKIILVDAQLAGEGASSRNSGYLVDTTLNDGFTSNKELENYKKKTEIYKLGINSVKKFVKEYQVDCDWNESGKYFASSKKEDEKILTDFSETLLKLGYEHNLLFKTDLTKKLGTSFYYVGLYTKGGFLLHPAKLIRAMIDTLPNNIELYENSSLLEWKKNRDTIICNFKNGQVITKKIIFATNGFLKSLGIKSNYNFPLTLTASMTRPLNDEEFKSIGEPKEWGVLPDNIIQSTWSGIVSRSRNSSQIFEKIDQNIFAVGCYNGSGIGVGTLFGEQIAIKASNEYSKEIETIESRTKPNWLPPNPFLNMGIKVRLFYERIRAKSEV